jgi:hypothetical protein
MAPSCIGFGLTDAVEKHSSLKQVTARQMYTEACIKISCCGLLTTKFLEHTPSYPECQQSSHAAAESPCLLGLSSTSMTSMP